VYAIDEIDKMNEKEFYGDWYSKKHVETRSDSLEGLWKDRMYPERQEVLARIGDLRGKSVLCLGNGAREKELYFSASGCLVISDIVTGGIGKVKRKYPPQTNVFFCAADAMNIPFRDGTFDVIYGWQMTHHLERMDKFASEVKRALKPGGKAVFVDNALSPAWQFVKWGILRPVTGVFLKKRGVSKRDLEFSMGGDYRERELEEMASKNGFKDFKASRHNLLSYIFLKAVRDVFKIQVTNKNIGLYQIGYTLSAFDRFMARRFAGYANNLRNMVWSFSKR